MLQMTKEERKQEFREFIGDIASDSFIRYLDSINYFDAPAAKAHHGAKLGGAGRT